MESRNGPPTRRSCRPMKRLAALATAALLVLGGPALASAGPGAGHVPSALNRFFGYQRTATYGSVRLTVQVPMRDGVHLGCYLYEPARKGNATPAPGRFAAVIDNFTPYYIAYPFGAFSGAFFATH